MALSVPPESEYARFKQVIAPLVPVQLDSYKQQQMERRIRDLARKHQAATLADFGTMLQRDVALRGEFERHITINVTQFYRNPDAFDYLRQRVLPALLGTTRGLHLWSAGCSFGAEPHTLAMLLHEAAPALRHTIRATDIDREMLAKAQLGQAAGLEDLQDLPQHLRERYVARQGPPFALSPAITRLVRFARHDLLRDPVEETYDLIACRNVVIYFTDPAKADLYQRFAAALRAGGYLFIGATEVIGAPQTFGLRYVAPCFYQKVAPRA